MTTKLNAGAASADISPKGSVFLFGYPFVKRYSTGIHDPLLATALYLDDGETRVLFIATDAIFVTKAITQNVRSAISKQTGVPAANILLSASHTHSGPKVGDYLSNEADPIIPKCDPKYVELLERGAIDAGLRAVNSAQPAIIGMGVADATGVGTNRHDPAGPADLRVPVVLVKTEDGKKNIAAMIVCNMHPTVLHENSTLVSGDFPAMARHYLQERVLGKDCVIVYHTGPSGNQSPRHVTTANTFAEAKRLGHVVGKAVEKVVRGLECASGASIKVEQAQIDLPLRNLPSVVDAEKTLKAMKNRLETLKKSGAARTDIRTAECDWFGAEETHTLARAAADGRLVEAVKSTMPAEIQIIRIGSWTFIAWPGEVFIEFALSITQDRPQTFLITLANGELQGYLVTQEAIDKNVYEAGNATFKSPDSPRMLVDATVKLLR
jgi:hypothetical protein